MTRTSCITNCPSGAKPSFPGSLLQECACRRRGVRRDSARNHKRRGGMAPAVRERRPRGGSVVPAPSAAPNWWYFHFPVPAVPNSMFPHDLTHFPSFRIAAGNKNHSRRRPPPPAAAARHRRRPPPPPAAHREGRRAGVRAAWWQ
eukprot:gene7492-biopygen15088